MEKLFIKNRKGQKISVIVEQPENPVGLAFVMHGLGGFKEQLHIEVMAKSFVDAGYTTVRFDATNAFGESDGDYADATVTNYFADLEDAISWAKNQKWYREPFVLAGHSLGGLCTMLFTEQHPELVKALAPIATVLSGEMHANTSQSLERMPEWKRTGWLITESHSKPGIMKKLKYGFIKDILRFDAMKDLREVTVPVLIIAGENDESTPLDQQKFLFDQLVGSKEFHVIKKAPHTIRDSEQLKELG